MSAELLRRAATKLREHADRAQPGPWLRAADHQRATAYEFPANAVGFWDGEYARQVTYQATGDGSDADNDARYIALMHPPVALAVADWLDVTAANISDFANVAGLERPGDLTETDEGAIAVARAILREWP